MRRPWIIAIVALTIWTGTSPALAMSCTVTAVTGIAFGSYDVFSASPLDSVGSVTYECSGVGPSDTISIDLSTGGASGYSPRRLAQGTHELEYDLCVDAGYSSVWGNGTSGTANYSQVSPPNGTPVSVPVYGRIPPGQNAHAGIYGDTVVVTVVF